MIRTSLAILIPFKLQSLNMNSKKFKQHTKLTSSIILSYINIYNNLNNIIKILKIINDTNNKVLPFVVYTKAVSKINSFPSK